MSTDDRPTSAARGTHTLSEAESKALLAQHGVPMPAERVVADADTAADAADAIGYPVVAKLCGDGIAHKTERGLVRLGLGRRRRGARPRPPTCSRRPPPTTARSACSSPRCCAATASSSPGWPTTRSSA